MARKITKRQLKEELALSIIARGGNFYDVSEKLDIGLNYSRRIYRNALDRMSIVDGDVSEHRKMLYEKSRKAEQMLWAGILEAERITISQIDTLRKLWDFQSKLLGAYAPTKIAPTDPTGEEEYRGVADYELVKQMVLESRVQLEDEGE